MGDRGKEFEDVAGVFRVLSNPGNVELLAVLSSGEFNPRELARLLGRDETDVSRRLRRLERVGLVSGEWRRVSGRNVRVYRLRGSRLCIRVSGRGVFVDIGGGGVVDPSVLARRLGSSLSPPRVSSWFTGRLRELEFLEASGPGLVVVVGLPGSGKTSLVARYVSGLGVPVAWYTVTGLESLSQVLWRLSLFFASLGDTSLYERLGASGLGAVEAAGIVAELLDRRGGVLVLDDFHRLVDKQVAVFVAEAASVLEKGRIIIATRRKPTSLLTEVPGARVLGLGGLSPREAKELLTRLGVELDPARFGSLYAATQGHPLLLKFFAEIAASRGLDEALRVLEKRGLGQRLWESIVAGLSASERRVLELLADVGAPVPAELVSSLCGCRAPLAALYRLLDLGLVDEAGGGYAARDLVIRMRPGRPRPSTLVAAGEWFLRSPGAEGIVAALRLFSEARDEKRVVKTIRARIASVGQEMIIVRDSYARWLSRVLEWAESEYTRAYVLAELGVVARDQGRYGDAVAKLRDAWSLARHYRDKCLLVHVLGNLLWHYPGRLGGEEASKIVGIVEKLLGQVEKETPCLLGALDTYYSNLAKYYAMQGDVDEALSAIRESLRVAEKRGAPREAAFSRAQLALVLGMKGRLEEAVAEAEEALSQLLLESPEPLVSRVKWILAELYLRVGRVHDAYRYARDSRSVFMEHGQYMAAASLMAIEVLSLIKMGSHHAAYSVARELKSLVEEKIGSWEGMELDGLAVAAAYTLAGHDAREFAEKLLRERLRRTKRVSATDAAPYIEVLHLAGLHDVAEELGKATSQGEA